MNVIIERILLEVIRVVQPRGGIFNLELDKNVLRDTVQYLNFLPPLFRLLFPVGLLFFEFGTVIFHGTITPFTRLPIDEKEKYIDGWVHSRWVMRRDLIRGIKGIAMMAYFEQPEVRKKIDFVNPEIVNERGTYRLKKYGKDIKRLSEEFTRLSDSK